MPWGDVAGYGVAIGVVQFGLLFLAIKLGMPAGLSSLVIQLQVFFTVGLAVAFLGDRLQRHNLIGAAIAASGIVLLAAFKLASGLGSTFIGFVLVIVAAFAWGVGNVIAKHAAGAHEPDMFALIVWSSLIPPLPLAALSYAFEGGPAVWHAVASAGALTWALRPRPRVGRDLVRLRLVGGSAASLPDGADLAVRAPDTRIGLGQRRDFPRRIAGTGAGARRRAGVRRSCRERLRCGAPQLVVAAAPLSPARQRRWRLHRGDARRHATALTRQPERRSPAAHGRSRAGIAPGRHAREPASRYWSADALAPPRPPTANGRSRIRLPARRR